MDDKNGSNLQENIFKAIQTIVDSEIKDVKFDKTIKCTITDATNRKDGEYTVSDGSIEFKAYSDQTTYRKGEQVLVNIGQGDMSEEKTILRRYTTEDSQTPVAYVPPLDSMVQVTKNVIDYGTFVDKNYHSKTGRYFSILANGDNRRPNVKAQNDTERTIWECDLTRTSLPYTIRSNAIYDTLGVKASFKTLLGANTYDVRTGRYGIKISLIYQPSTETSDNPLTATYVLDSIADMTGNPYEYQIFFDQQKTINISNIGQITYIKISLYQSGVNENGIGTFQYYDSHDGKLKELPYKIDSKTNSNEKLYLPDNIFVSEDITLTFGYDTSKLDDNTLMLVTNDSPFYDFIQYSSSDAINHKSVYALWINKTEDNEYLGFSDGIYQADYDETVYQKEYYEKVKGVDLQNQELLIAVPPLLEALQVYANAKEINDRYTALQGYVSGQTSLSATTSLFQVFNDLRSFFAYKQGGEALLDYIPIEYKASAGTGSILLTGSALALSNAIETALLSTRGTETNSARATQTIYNNFITQYNGYYNSGERLESYPKINTTPMSNQADIDVAWGHFLNTMVTNFDNLFKQSKNIENGYVTVQNAKFNYDTIISRIQQEMDKLQELVPATQGFCDGLTRKFIDNNMITVDEDYAKLVSKNENRYDIRWYRYNPLASDSIAGPGWEYLTKENCPGYVGSGLPNKKVSDHYDKYCDENINGIRNMSMEPYEDKESLIIKAILYFNHEMFESNEIEFTNANPVVDTTTAGAANGLQVTLGEGSSASYQLYGITNMLLNAAEAQVRREIRVDYLDPASKQINNEPLFGGEVHWFVPSHNTMLTFDDNFLSTQYGFSAAAESETKTGYWEFRKYITSADDLNFFYNISSVYVSSAVNNTIICEITSHKIKYSGKQEFVFNTYGNSGTDYSLTIKTLPNTNLAFIEDTTKTDGVGNTFKRELQLGIDLYDFDGKKIAQNCELSITPSYNNTIFQPSVTSATISDAEQLKINIQSFNTSKTGISPTENYYGLYNILTVKVNDIEKNDKRTIDLESYYPIPFSTGDYYLEGPTTIIYNSQGQNPNYYKAPYKLYDRITNAEVSNVNFTLVYYSTKSRNHTGALYNSISDKERPYLPVLNEKNMLVPLNLYVEDMGYNVVVVASTTANKFLFAQPLIIMQNRYPSGALNSWDGSLTIDEENGTILSTMVGAGRKNEDDNTFSGVLMGDVASNDGSTELGIYGFHHGGQSFGFKADGKGFIGKAGHGRIILDGDTGEIKSATWDDIENQGLPGMRIDLDDGIIRMRGPYTNNGAHAEVLISAGKELDRAISYLEIKDDGEYKTKRKLTLSGDYTAADDKYGDFTSETLIKVANKEFYLQSHDFSDVSTLTENSVPQGFKMDLLNGKIQAANFTLLGYGIYNPSKVFKETDNANEVSLNEATLGSLVITTDDTAFPISLGPGLTKKSFNVNNANFAIGWDGTMIAKRGKVGGWSLLNDRLQSNDGKVGIASKTASKTAVPTFGENNQLSSGIDYPVFWADNTIAPYGTGDTGVLNQDNWMNMNFYVTIGGQLHATRGEIGSWTITKDSLYSQTGTVYSILAAPSGYNNANRVVAAFGIDASFKSGDKNNDILTISDGGVTVNSGKLDDDLQSRINFYIRQNGMFYAKEGKIGSWNVNSYRIYGSGSDKSTNGAKYAVLNAPAVATQQDNQWILIIGSTGPTTNSAPLMIDLAGNLWSKKLHAEGADIKGKIEADSGTIAGWKITSENGVSMLQAGSTKLYSTGQVYTGYLNAWSGTIGGWTINKGSLSAGNTYLNSSGSISGAKITGGTITGSNINVADEGSLTVGGSITWGGSTVKKVNFIQHYAYLSKSLKVCTPSDASSVSSHTGYTGGGSTYYMTVWDSSSKAIGHCYLPSHRHSFSYTQPSYGTHTLSALTKKLTLMGLEDSDDSNS